MYKYKFGGYKMKEYVPVGNEQLFEVKPIGVKYICEFCNNGEMIADSNQVIEMKDGHMVKLFVHKCKKCGRTMQLPKVYPHIEWLDG